jgi:alanine dehydrogenase
LKTLILTSDDIERIIDMDMVIEAVENAFEEYGKGKTIMPAKIYLPLEQYQGDFRAMPAFVGGSAGLKWVNVHPRNRIKTGLPTVMAVFIYSDPETGFPLAIMDGTIITNYRTSASGAVASKYLARKESKSLGLIGCGAQAQTQLEAISRFFNFDVIRVFAPSEDSINTFIARNSAFNIKKASTEEATKSDIICTTTPVKKPIIDRAWIEAGTHINAIGADAKGKQELDPAILLNAKVVVDDVAQASHSGEINVPITKGIYRKENIYATLGEVVAGSKPGREGNEITVFDSTGLAIQDVATAKVIVEEAKRLKIGSETNLVCPE